MGLVKDCPVPEHEALWQSITPESVSEPELRMAMDRALHLYLKWLRDDLHSVFRLLAVQSRVSNNSLERARTTANTLSRIAEDAHWIKAQPMDRDPPVSSLRMSSIALENYHDRQVDRG